MEKYLVNTYDNHWVECDSAESAAQAVKVEPMITNKEYFERWERFLVEYCHCYADDNSNRPCDNGVVCCYCDSMIGIFWDEINKVINTN